MATNWNAVLANINNSNDILAILKKILPLLDGKVDATTIDEVIAQLNKIAEDGQITIDEALETINFLQQKIDEKTNAFNDAIEAAAAAGAGANGWNSLLVQDGSENQKEINDKSKQYVDTLADLLALNVRKNGQLAEVSRFATDRQFGGGTFKFNQSRVAENDGISIFNGWERCQLPEKISPFLAGAYGDFTSDDIDAIEKAKFLARTLNTSVLINGSFAVSREIVINSGDSFVGTKLVSRIKKLNNSVSNLERRIAPERAANSYDYYDVDTILNLYPDNNAYVHDVSFTNIYLYNKVYGDNMPGAYGVYAPRVANLDLSGVRVENVERAFKSKNIYQSRISDFVAIANQTSGFVNEGKLAFDISDNFAGSTGTSNFFDNLLFVNYEYAFNIENLQTTTFLKCYGEQIHKQNGTAESINFRFLNPFNITMISCGQEQTRCTPLYIASDLVGSTRASISIEGFQAVWGTMGTSVNTGMNLTTVLGPVDVTIKTSTIKKSDFEIFDGIYMSGNCRVFNMFSEIGTQVNASASSIYIDAEKTLMKDGDAGMTKSSISIGDDLNNGIEWKEGVVNKIIKGATKNCPSGVTDAWGVSTYYGLSPTEGIQVLNLTNSTHAWRRQILSRVNFGDWQPY